MLPPLDESYLRVIRRAVFTNITRQGGKVAEDYEYYKRLLSLESLNCVWHVYTRAWEISARLKSTVPQDLWGPLLLELILCEAEASTARSMDRNPPAAERWPGTLILEIDP